MHQHPQNILDVRPCWLFKTLLRLPIALTSDIEEVFLRIEIKYLHYNSSLYTVFMPQKYFARNALNRTNE